MNTLMAETAALDAAINGCPDDDKAPRYCLDTIKPAMERYNSRFCSLWAVGVFV